MKNTKVFIVIVVTLLATWFTFGVIGSFTSSESIRTCMSSPFMFYPMIVIGWIPCSVVAFDYREYLDKQEQG